MLSHAESTFPNGVLAARPPAHRGRLHRMPRSLRLAATLTGFFAFFGVSAAIGLVVVLLSALFGARDRWAFTTRLNRRLALFAGFLRDLGLIDFWHPQLPPGLDQGAYLLVANHPTLLDVVLLLSSFPRCTCVAKAGWYRSWLLGPLLRATEYVPGPGMPGDGAPGIGDPPVSARIEAKLRAGIPVLVFPEGTRSGEEELRRFRRGAIEAAFRAGVPILPLFIGPSTPFLMKGQPWWDVPPQSGGFCFEWFPPVFPDAAKDPVTASKATTKALFRRYRARFAALLAERKKTVTPR